MPLKVGSVVRTAPPSQDEVPLLRWWLDWHRDGLLLNCEGLTAEQLRRRAVPPSKLTLLGLVLHVTVLERTYWRRAFLGDATIAVPEGDEEDFDAVAATDPAAAFAAWRAERDHADRILDTHPFDALGAGGQSVRFWVLKLVNEYARHNGHADLLRERIDGAIGE
jgi:hypothetical protein